MEHPDGATHPLSRATAHWYDTVPPFAHNHIPDDRAA